MRRDEKRDSFWGRKIEGGSCPRKQKERRRANRVTRRRVTELRDLSVHVRTGLNSLG